MRRALGIFTLALALLVIPLVAEAKKTAAVMPLGKGAGGSEFDGLGRALADMMVTDLSQAEVLVLVERTKLSLVLDELKLAKSGFLDKRTAQKLGHGLGAQLVITGTFSVIEKQFVMDCRIIEVKSGVIVKTARSQGLVGDFIAIEKDVVEKLLSGLQVKLSPGARRKLLIATPTESMRALASYGRGVEASEAGQVESAKKAFEEALQRDPDFAKASLALGALATSIEKASRDHTEKRRDKRQRGLDAALKALVPETSRAANFVDTRSSMLDFTIRQQLLETSKQHCQRYKELKHYLYRRKGEFAPWFEGLGRDFQRSYRMGSDLMDERGKALGVVGPGTVHGTRGGNLIFAASSILHSGMSLLTSRSLHPEQLSSILAVLSKCHSAAVQVAEFDDLFKHAKRWAWIDKPISKTHGVGWTTITARDVLTLHWAYLRAQNRGIDKRVTARTDAVLARHPEGDNHRSQVISRIQQVVDAGASHERRVASRYGLSETAIVAKARALVAKDGKAIFLSHPVCQYLVDRIDAQRALKRYEEALPRGLAFSKKQRFVNALGVDVGPLVLAGCYRQGKKKPLSSKQILQLAARSLKRPHPAGLTEKHCLDTKKRLEEALQQRGNTPQQQYYILDQLRSARFLRCLLP